MYQPEALGVSEELKKRGYALMCVAFPDSDCVLETVPEDEVYDMQFGRYFAQQALNKNAPSVQRDDFALEIAQVRNGKSLRDTCLASIISCSDPEVVHLLSGG